MLEDRYAEEQSKTLFQLRSDAPLEASIMKSTYFEDDDILQIRVSDKCPLVS